MNKSPIQVGNWQLITIAEMCDINKLQTKQRYIVKHNVLTYQMLLLWVFFFFLFVFFYCVDLLASYLISALQDNSDKLLVWVSNQMLLKVFVLMRYESIRLAFKINEIHSL